MFGIGKLYDIGKYLKLNLQDQKGMVRNIENGFLL